MEENRKEIVSDACIYNTLGITLTHTQRQTNGLTGTHTHCLAYLNTQRINVVLVRKL